MIKIIFIVIGVIAALGFGGWLIWNIIKIKKNKGNKTGKGKLHDTKNKEQELATKNFIKNNRVINFHDFYKNTSGIVIASGYKKRKILENKQVVKNLTLDKEDRRFKEIDTNRWSVCVTNKPMSACMIAPPGSGKTQSFVLPNIVYLSKCKSKPIMIITDPKGEVRELLEQHLTNMGYSVYNISTLEKTNDDGEFLTDFWNPLQVIIDLHKQLIAENDSLVAQDISSKIMSEIDIILNSLDTTENKKSGPDYWNECGLAVIKFMLTKILLEIELGLLKKKIITKDADGNEIEVETDGYEDVNLHNIKQQISLVSAGNLLKKVDALNRLQIVAKSKTYRILKNYLSWSQEREENVGSFLTNANNNLSVVETIYFKLLTSKTTINLNDDLSKLKPICIFLTSNMSATTGRSEAILLGMYLKLLNSKIMEFKNNIPGAKDKDVFWILDECGNISKLPFLSNIIDGQRGNRIFAVPIFQNLEQIKKIYGSTGIYDSCEYKLWYTNDNVEIGNRISMIAGSAVDNEGQQIKKIETSFFNNIPRGYMGLSTFKRDAKESPFYILPVTYYYMMYDINTAYVESNKFSQAKSNEKYLLTNHESDFDIRIEEEIYTKPTPVKVESEVVAEPIKETEVDLKQHNEATATETKVVEVVTEKVVDNPDNLKEIDELNKTNTDLRQKNIIMENELAKKEQELAKQKMINLKAEQEKQAKQLLEEHIKNFEKANLRVLDSTTLEKLFNFIKDPNNKNKTKNRINQNLVNLVHKLESQLTSYNIRWENKMVPIEKQDNQYRQTLEAMRGSIDNINNELKDILDITADKNLVAINDQLLMMEEQIGIEPIINLLKNYKYEKR